MSCLDGMIDGTDIEPPSRMAGWEAASRTLPCGSGGHSLGTSEQESNHPCTGPTP